MQTVGERLAILREKRNLSQPQLAKELNVATSTIGMWDNEYHKYILHPE